MWGGAPVVDRLARTVEDAPKHILRDWRGEDLTRELCCRVDAIDTRSPLKNLTVEGSVSVLLARSPIP